MNTKYADRIGWLVLAILTMVACMILAMPAMGQDYDDGYRWNGYRYNAASGLWFKGGQTYRLETYTRWGKRYTRYVAVQQPDVTLNINSFNSLAPQGQTIAGKSVEYVPSLNDLTIAQEALKLDSWFELQSGNLDKITALLQLGMQDQNSSLQAAVLGDAQTKTLIAAAKLENEKARREEVRAQMAAEVSHAITGAIDRMKVSDTDEPVIFTVQIQPGGGVTASAESQFPLVQRCAGCHSGEAENGGGHVLFPLSKAAAWDMAEQVEGGKMPRRDGKADPYTEEEIQQFKAELRTAITAE